MRDLDIRRSLRTKLHAEHAQDPDTLIVEELGLLQGAARVDLAVVNGSISAFEIKSERDTLRRLDGQAEAYGKVFDAVTLVASRTHLRNARDCVPKWWGLASAEPDARGVVTIVPRRRARLNRRTVPAEVAKLLWREEALALLERRGLADGLRSKPRRVLWTALADQLTPEDLAGEVRATLKGRQGWRADPQRP